MGKRWASVPSHPEYLVSTDGEVFSTYAKRILKPSRNQSGTGYFMVFLNGEPMTNHRAVASAFIGPLRKGFEVNHKNGIKTDNRLENLEVITKAENAKHSQRVLGNPPPPHKRGTDHWKARLSERDVLEIRRLYAAGETQMNLAATFGVKQAHVSRIVHRQTWKHIT